MSQSNQRQRQTLSRFAIDPSTQVTPASSEPGGQVAGPAETPGGPIGQTYLPGQLAQQPVPQEQTRRVQGSAGPTVHAGFPKAPVQALGTLPQARAQLGAGSPDVVDTRQGRAPTMAARPVHHQVASPATAMQPTVSPFQVGIAAPAGLESRPAIGSPGMVHPTVEQAPASTEMQTAVGQPQQVDPSARVQDPSVRAPPMTAFDEGENLVIEFELPGVAKKDIELVGLERGLVLKADAETDVEEGQVLASEGGGRIYQRKVPLDVEILADEVSANFQNGILEVTLPKKEPTAGAKPVEIQ